MNARALHNTPAGRDRQNDHAHGTGEHGTGEHGGTCDHATERAAVAAEALTRAETVCAQRGARLTAIRRDVLEALYTTHRPLGAYDIADIMARQAERRVAPITIYRALEFLLEQGFIHKLETRNAFIACPHAHEPGELVAFLICEACGGVDEVSSPAFSGSLVQVLAQAHFRPRTRVVEIAGVCGHCDEAGMHDDSVAEPV